MVQGKVITVETSPFEGQKPGTSGLRKPVATFMQPRYTENFVQATLDVALKGKSSPKDVTLVVGGDGRYFSKPAIEAIIALAAGNGVSLNFLKLSHFNNFGFRWVVSLWPRTA